MASSIIVGIGGLQCNGCTPRSAYGLEAEAKAGPHVEVVSGADKTRSDRTLTLVGEARPFASVTLYAKVSGYLKSVKVDKGDKVKKDQFLAVIESPEIDKAYQGALADAENKKSIAGRMNHACARAIWFLRKKRIRRTPMQKWQNRTGFAGGTKEL